MLLLHCGEVPNGSASLSDLSAVGSALLAWAGVGLAGRVGDGVPLSAA